MNPGSRNGRLWWVLVCGVTLGGVTRVAAPPAGAAGLPSAEALRKLCGEDWYTVSVLGKSAGYAHHKTRQVGIAGAGQIETVERVVVHISVGGPAVPIESEQLTRFDAALKPVFYRLCENDMGREKSVEATLEPDGLHVSTVAPDGRTSRVLPVGPDYGSDLEMSVDLLNGALKAGDRKVIQTFSPDLGALDETTVTVAAVPTPADGRYKLVAKSKLLGIEAAAYITPDGTMVRQESPGLLNMTLVRVSEAEAMAAGVSPLRVSNSITLDRVIPDTSELSQLTLIARGKAESPVSYLPVSPRQEVTGQADESAVVRLTRRTHAGAAPPLPIQDPQLTEYLKATEVAQSENPEIVRTAREIVGTETDSWRAAQALNGWVFRKMKKVESEPRPVTALEVLHSMTGDCTEHAVLLATLARAVGLPSQMVTGVVYKRGAFWYHAWDKVYVGEWVDVDPSWGETSINVGHVELAHGSLDNLSMARMNLATGRTIGTLQLEAKDWK